MGTAAATYSIPKLYAQSSSANAASANATTAAANVPIAVANGISARALALGFTTAESSKRPDIYLTATDHPNQVLALAAAIRGVTSANAGANLVAIGGTGEAGSLGDGGAATAAQLNLKLDSPNARSGVAIAADGTMFIADTRNSTIRRIAAPSSTEVDVIRSVAGKWAPQQNVQLVEPMGIALDRAGNLYIADHGANALIELHSATSASAGRLEILAHIAQPASIAVAADGSRIFVASPESGNVFSFETQTRAIAQVFGASGSTTVSTSSRATSPTATHAGACSVSSNSVAASAATAINSAATPCPAGVAVDGGGNLFVADSAGGKILRLDAATRQITTAASSLSAPGEIAFDVNGNLFIAEQGRTRIAEIQGLGQPVSSVTLTPPAPITPPAGVPCPAIAPPGGSSSNFNFCAEPLAGTTPLSAFTLTNDSNADITNITVGFIGLNPGDFVSPTNSCTATLRANSSCSINVGFAPTATGSRTAMLVVNYSGASLPLNTALAGTGDDYQIALASGQLTEISVLAGNAATFMLQVVPDNIFTGTITLVCPGNLPAQTTCAFSPGATVDVTAPGTPVPFSVTFQTTSRTPTNNLVPRNPGANYPGIFATTHHRTAAERLSAFARALLPMAWIDRIVPARTMFPVSSNHRAALAAAFSALAIFFWVALASAKPRRRTQLLRVATLFALALSVTAVLEGCGGGGPEGTAGTPAGANKLTVQGATQGASRGLTVTLDVE